MLSSFDLLIIVTAIVIMICGFTLRWSAWRSGQQEKRRGSLTGVLKYILGHSTIRRKQGIGVAHLIVFWGFVLPLIVIILAQFDFKLPRVPSEIISLILDVAGIAFLAGSAFFLIRRILSKDRLGPEKVIFPMIILFIVLITGFLAEGARLSILPTETSWASPFGWLFSLGLPSSPDFMKAMIRIHFLAVFVFIAIIPFTFFRHLASGPLNVYFRRTRSRGELRKADLKSGHTGADTVSDFTWKQLLESEACLSCGRCEENCPAAISGKPLSPRKVMKDIFELMMQKKKSVSDIKLESKITGDEIWSCTTCMACIEHCPVFIEPVDRIVEMRRNLVMGKGRMPAEAVTMIRNLELYGDVQGKGVSHRTDWARNEFGMNRDVPEYEKNMDVLLWLGCSAEFHPRYQEVARSLVKILSAAGVSFGVLGKNELCCGDPARRLGEESVFLQIAEKNIQTLKNFNVKKILTLCPHCYNTLKNEYPNLGDASNAIKDIEVVHAAEFAMDLIKAKRIMPKYPLNKNIAIHDPCYLGRVNGIYEQPRDIIRNLPGSNLKEFERHHENGFCCGGGGGGMWLHEHLGKRMNVIRSEEAVEAGVDVIGTACPYCLTMLDDGISGLDLSKPPKVLDIIEILASSI